MSMPAYQASLKGFALDLTVTVELISSGGASMDHHIFSPPLAPISSLRSKIFNGPSRLTSAMFCPSSTRSVLLSGIICTSKLLGSTLTGSRESRRACEPCILYTRTSHPLSVGFSFLERRSATKDTVPWTRMVAR